MAGQMTEMWTMETWREGVGKDCGDGYDGYKRAIPLLISFISVLSWILSYEDFPKR